MASTVSTWTSVRTILVLGYWVLGNIHRYWVVLLLGFCCSDPQYYTNQTAVSTVHMPVNDYLVSLLTCTLTDAIVCLDTMLICYCLLNTIIVIIIEFLDFSWSLLCYTLVSVLVLVWVLVLVSLEANIIGYWILGAFLGIILTITWTVSVDLVICQPLSEFHESHF